MIRKTIVRLSEESIPAQIIQTILSNNNTLNRIDTNSNIYLFEFNDFEFLHASILLGLLGQNSQRFGFDLRYYLDCILSVLRSLKSEYVILDLGSRDFKRRASEDLSIGIASLFMVKSFRVKWRRFIKYLLTNDCQNLRPILKLLQMGKNTYLKLRGQHNQIKWKSFS